MCWIIDHHNLLGMMEEVLGQSEGPDEEDAGPAESGEELARGQTGEEENALITELLENEVVSIWKCLFGIKVEVRG